MGTLTTHVNLAPVASRGARRSIGFVSLVLFMLAAGASCKGQAEGRQFRLKTIIYANSMTIGQITAGTTVEVYPTYIVIRRPPPGPTTVVPMSEVRAIDVE